MNDLIKIFRVGVSEADKIAGQTNEPHHHEFEELLLGKKGQLEHFIDFQSTLMDAPFVSFVTQGKIHRVRPLPKDGECDIWVIRFKNEFIAETTFQLYASFHDNASFCMKADDCFERMELLCDMMYREYSQPAPDLAVIRQLLTTLFTVIESERGKLNLAANESRKIQSITFRNFLKLLEAHFREARDVNFYAEKLFMSARNLNLICQSVLQQSVSEIIETRKLTEAKNLLLTTDLTVAEIGYELGFKEKTYFTHTFKRKAGMTPTDFRKEMNGLIS
ncbi:helix-turn-helix domain-containing protein [Flavobacterium silvaticum]|uniref:Helix-turn-helix domain-containing protein n=1 Tax=Flavobacterium silvaticum TaxID=1852020 RepID=A0A972FMT8_9FLAO|nr:response regulator transcription factor [Flavobacterium silvaticum]NMH28577.1 helix-turn-helix domain-containing protein [Flavobacterium silvaticum]